MAWWAMHWTQTSMRTWMRMLSSFPPRRARRRCARSWPRATAIDAVIFADRTLGEVLRGMPIDVIRIAAVSAFLLGTIVVSALLARQSGQRLLRARQGRGVPKYGTIPS